MSNLSEYRRVLIVMPELTVHTWILFDQRLQTNRDNVSITVDTASGLIVKLFERNNAVVPFAETMEDGDIDLREKYLVPGLVGAHIDIFLHSYEYAPTSVPIPRNNQTNRLIPVTQITDAQLWGLTFDAYSFIDDDLDQYDLNPDYQYPGALSVLAWGNEIILASSQKGSNSFTYEGKKSGDEPS